VGQWEESREQRATPRGGTRWRGWREAWEPLLLAGLVALVFTRSDDVRKSVRDAAGTQLAIRSDADFFRAPPVLGPEYAILERLQRDFPPGTKVSLVADTRGLARLQHFWLALLPQYPISSRAELAICTVPCARPGDVELERGERFVLLRRPDGAVSSP
jgi:hypothetical protein